MKQSVIELRSPCPLQAKLSAHQQRLAKMVTRVRDMEQAAMEKKDWFMRGEVDAGGDKHDTPDKKCPCTFVAHPLLLAVDGSNSSNIIASFAALGDTVAVVRGSTGVCNPFLICWCCHGRRSP